MRAENIINLIFDYHGDQTRFNHRRALRILEKAQRNIKTIENSGLYQTSLKRIKNEIPDKMVKKDIYDKIEGEKAPMDILIAGTYAKTLAGKLRFTPPSPEAIFTSSARLQAEDINLRYAKSASKRGILTTFLNRKNNQY